MSLYLIRRILIFLPTLVVISILSFGLSKIAPGDPVELYLRRSFDSDISIPEYEKTYKQTSIFLELDRPAFYFALSTSAHPDTLYRIFQPDRRRMLRKMIGQYGNWNQIAAYYHTIGDLAYRLDQIPDTVALEEKRALRSGLLTLFSEYRHEVITRQLDRFDELAGQHPALSTVLAGPVEQLQTKYLAVRSEKTRWKLFLPALHWYGFDNQYHRWLARFLRGHFGISYYDGLPVAEKLRPALFWTLIINGLAIILAYGLSIPLGVFSAVRRGSTADRSTTVFLFLLYSLPTFWIATMLLVFFTTPEYGMDFFPSLGLGEVSETDPLGVRLKERASHLVLPVISLSYGALAFLSRQMRGGMIDVLGQDYIRTARAKGLSNRQVIWKHAFRNSLFPMITLFGSIFPAVLAGSVVIEVIFNIPGMGKLTVDAIYTRNWPVVYTVLMLGAVLTMVGTLLADILYAVADPRVRFGKSNRI